MNPLLTVLTSVGFATIVVTIVNAITQRRKLSAEAGQLSADATKIITDAASGVVKDIRADNDRLRKENDRLRQREDELERRVDELENLEESWKRERTEWRRVLMIHGAWDLLAITAIRKAMPPIDIEDVPPLTPSPSVKDLQVD